MLKKLACSLVIVALACSCSLAQEYINHNDYQAVTSTGGRGYTDGEDAFPITLIGVVLNNTEDWLDPTADYFFDGFSFEMGGEAEFYVQAVDLTGFDFSGTGYNPPASVQTGDFSGTACYMAQNYGNTYRNDPMYSYSNTEWYSELDRLGLWRNGSEVAEENLVRAGDLVVITANTGKYYKGKMNVNEDHSNEIENDFTVEILQKNYGLPDAIGISLSAIQDEYDVAIFDETRAAGGEFYQSTLVELTNVWFKDEDLANWGSDADLTVTDSTGRTLNVHVGLNSVFDSMAVPKSGQLYDLTGILDQSSSSGMDGYQLLLLDPSYISQVPEPATLAIFTMLAAGVAARRKRN